MVRRECWAEGEKTRFATDIQDPSAGKPKNFGTKQVVSVCTHHPIKPAGAQWSPDLTSSTTIRMPIITNTYFQHKDLYTVTLFLTTAR